MYSSGGLSWSFFFLSCVCDCGTFVSPPLIVERRYGRKEGGRKVSTRYNGKRRKKEERMRGTERRKESERERIKEKDGAQSLLVRGGGVLNAAIYTHSCI